MGYELWSSVSRNLLADFASEAEALDCVREIVAAQGEAGAQGFAVIYENRRGRSRLIAEGQALVERALASAPAETTAPEKPAPV